VEVSQAVREFKYNGVALKDPGAEYSIEQVREFYSTIYPEIVNADIEGPENVGTKVVYEFRRAVGTKGAQEAADLRARLVAIVTGKDLARSAPPGSFPFDLDGHKPLMKGIAAAVHSSLTRYHQGEARMARTAAPSASLPPLP
jgi:PRTRC genetic system protein C